MPSVLVHGGAGRFFEGDDVRSHELGCLEAARAGQSVLLAGGSALDAVIEAVVRLEANPLFNAGVGAALNERGEVELDAAVMEGQGLRAGAVGALRGFTHPVRIARSVMDESPHVLLVGEGAATFAKERGHAPCESGSLITPRAKQRLAEERARRLAESPSQPTGQNGTVGAVAIDVSGHVAAATSTGGMTMKREGRVGDSPLVGCGTYADDLSGAVSVTGHGEAIIRVVLAKFACDRLRAGSAAQEAAEEAIRELERVGGDGGIIVVDRAGRLGHSFNSERMSRAWVLASGEEGSAFKQP